jgi:putative transposase
MNLSITAKIQVLTTAEDARNIAETMRTYCDACNYVSKYVFATHELNQFVLQDGIYHRLRDVFGLKSQMAVSVVRTVIARYKAIRENQHRWIRPDFKRPQIDLVWNRDYSLSGERFSVNTLEGRVKLQYASKGMERYFDHSKYKFGTARLVRQNGKFFLHIPVTLEADDVPYSSIANVVGIDRGVNFVVATYDSNHKSGFVSGHAIKQRRAHYALVRKQLQSKGTPSSRRRLKEIGSRENRWMQDINHCVSKALVENNPKRTLFVLEDLGGVRSATEKVSIRNRYVTVSWAFFDLEQKLIYKAELHGDKVIKVDPAYTSQTCPKCGHTEKANRDHHKHVFRCKCCGYESNDDRIGAMNLYRKGVDFLSTKSPDTVESQHI